jgi:hypothetical protein
LRRKSSAETAAGGGAGRERLHGRRRGSVGFDFAGSLLGNADARVEGHRSFRESICGKGRIFGARYLLVWSPQPLRVGLRCTVSTALILSRLVDHELPIGVFASATALRESVAEVFQVSQAEGRAQICAKVNPILLWDGEENFDNLGIELRA